MEKYFEYQKSDYFNDKDYFVIKGIFCDVLVTRVSLYNGSWYANCGQQYKMTSIKSFNSTLLEGKEAILDGKWKGIITVKRLEPDQLGFYPYKGLQIQKYGLCLSWNNVKNLKLVE